MATETLDLSDFQVTRITKDFIQNERIVGGQPLKIGTLGFAVRSRLRNLIQGEHPKAPDFIRQFEGLYLQHNLAWVKLPDSLLTGVFAELLVRMNQALGGEGELK